MKFTNYYSILSMLISVALIIAKLLWEINVFQSHESILENKIVTKGISPSLVAGHIKIFLFYSLIPLILSFILMIMGMVNQSKYRFVAFALALLTFIFTLIPFGTIIAFNYLIKH